MINIFKNKSRTIQITANGIAIAFWLIGGGSFGWGKNPYAQLSCLSAGLGFAIVGSWHGSKADRQQAYIQIQESANQKFFAQFCAKQILGEETEKAIAQLPPVDQSALPPGETGDYAAKILQALASDSKPIAAEFIDAVSGISAIRLKFRINSPRQMFEATKRADLIHAACELPKQSQPCIFVDRGCLVVDVPRQNREYPRFNLFPERATDTPQLILGIDSLTKEPIYHVLTPKGESASFLFAGASGSGKSVAANAMLLSAIYRYSPNQIKFAIVDCKGGSYSWLENSPWLWSGICEDAVMADCYLQQIINEGVHRQELFKLVKVRDIEGYNKKSESKLSIILFLVDELAEWMAGLTGSSECSPADAQVKLARIAQKMRNVGIFLALGTQKPVVEDKQGKFPVVGTLLKGNLTYRLAFKVATPKESEIALGNMTIPNASQLLGKGDFLWQTSDGNLVRGQSLYIPDDDNTELERLHQIALNFHCPDRDRTPVQANFQVQKYLQSLENSFQNLSVPALKKRDRFWDKIKALKMHPLKPSKTQIIQLIWGVSGGGSHFNRANPDSEISQYEQCSVKHREEFVELLLKLGAKPDDIVWAAWDARSGEEKAKAMAELKAIAQAKFFGWPYYQLNPKYTDDLGTRYSPNWSKISRQVRSHDCVITGEKADIVHHAYYRSWWGKVADNEPEAIGIALFSLSHYAHRPDNYLFIDCAHNPTNWLNNGTWDAMNTLEYFINLI